MSQLSDQLRAAGIVQEADLEAAMRRQQIYGGSLDTVLLELELIDEPTLDVRDATQPPALSRRQRRAVSLAAAVLLGGAGLLCIDGRLFRKSADR